MTEYISEAVVLSRDDWREADSRVHMLTEKYGKITAHARSARKITSKLSAHLEPGMLSLVRVVESKGFQVVDALKKSRAAAALSDLEKISRLLAPQQAEPELWRLIGENFVWTRALSFLGWDPEHAPCLSCAAAAQGFYVPRQEFYCLSCLAPFYDPSHAIIY